MPHNFYLHSSIVRVFLGPSLLHVSKALLLYVLVCVLLIYLLIFKDYNTKLHLGFFIILGILLPNYSIPFLSMCVSEPGHH